jgi:SWI/SNF-related matrix-associated actin-dependent regulator of chromatin subfamily A-like protein 1
MRAPYCESFIAAIKKYPGCRYAGWKEDKAAWFVPQELHEVIRDEAVRHHIRPAFTFNRSGTKPVSTINQVLYPFQQDAVSRAFLEGSLLVSFETGLGKGAVGSEVLRLAEKDYCLVVCPASMRNPWREEIHKWWPDAIVEVIESKDQWDGYDSDADVTVCSYGTLCEEMQQHWDVIILDESHFCKNPKAQRTKAVRALCDANPDAIKLALTATPMDKLPDLFNQLDLLWPKRLGWFGKTTERYAECEVNSYGYPQIVGLNPEHAEEFRLRLRSMVCRATKSEYAHLLPPFTVQRLRLRAKDYQIGKPSEPRKGKAFDVHQETADHIRRASPVKVRGASEWVYDRRECGDRKLIVVFYYRESLAEFAKLHPEAVLVHGEMPVAEREEALRRAKLSDEVLVAATMKSINVGIDLTAFPIALVAELYSSMPVMIQLLGRFSRLSGKVPSKVELLTLEGTVDEILADGVLGKLKTMCEVFDAGQAESQLLGALGHDDSDDADFIESLRAAFGGDGGQEHNY